MYLQHLRIHHAQTGVGAAVQKTVCDLHLYNAVIVDVLTACNEGIFKVLQGFGTIMLFGDEQQRIVRLDARDRLPDHHRQNGDDGDRRQDDPLIMIEKILQTRLESFRFFGLRIGAQLLFGNTRKIHLPCHGLTRLSCFYLLSAYHIAAPKSSV